MGQIAAGNGNKDGYSIRAAALDLAKRTERRKILMVLSDGLPSGYFSEAEAIDDVRTAVQAARAGACSSSPSFTPRARTRTWTLTTACTKRA